MNVKVYSSGVLAYDNQLPEEKGYSMLSIRIQDGVNKGGTATLVLPPKHRLRDGFPAMNSLIEIYRDGKLRWRGRPLPHEDDFYGRRTILCEGELCFLNDASMRPYTLTGSPEEIFRAIVDVYNAAVDPWKRFVVGVVTVVSDAAVEISSTLPEQAYSAVMRLISKCSGYIFFDSADDGTRRINWYADFPYTCNQPIRFAKNLLDYSTTASVTGLATRIIPYGALDGNGKRITIDVDGKDYVENAAAQAERGIIEKSVIYEGVTDPAELQVLAERDVQFSGTIPETIKLSAVDLSRMDASLDAFAVGQVVPAESAAHNLTGQYYLVSIDEDLVQPSVGAVTLTRDAKYYDGSGSSLSGSVSNQTTEIGEMSSGWSAIVKAEVSRATAWLTNGKGYKVERVDENGNTIDTLYMDTPDINTAVHVLRIGQSGIGFSANGVDGPYVSAWTLDGRFNADFILTGTLMASLIKAGVLQSKDGKTFVLDLDNNTLKANFTELAITGKSVDEIAQAKADAAEDNAVGQAVDIAQSAVNSQTQEDIFNKLTNNGAAQGIFIKDGQLYVNVSYLAAGVITSADGSVQIDLLNNNVVINTMDGDNPGRLILSSDGLHGWGWDHSTNAYVRTFILSVGNNGDGDSITDTYTSLTTWQGNAGLAIAPGKSSAVLRLGNTASETIIRGSHVSVKPGKTLLYSGTCAVGSTCNVPNTEKYDLFSILLGTASGTYMTPVLAYKVGEHIRGIGGFSGTSAESKKLYYVTVNISGDTWTLVDACRHIISRAGSVGEAEDLSIKEIRGII